MGVSPAELRALALALPEVADVGSGGRVCFEVDGQKICWSWMERLHPKKPRVMNAGVAIRIAMARKELLMEAAPQGEVASLLAEGWRIQASARLKAAHPGV